MALSVEEWLEAYRQAWENTDPDAASRIFTEDAQYRSNIYEEPHHGRQGVHDYWTGVTAVQSEVTVRMGRPFVDGQRVAAEFWTKMAIEGNPVTLSGCLLLEFDDSGLCRRLREYFTFTEGTVDPPEVWGT